MLTNAVLHEKRVALTKSAHAIAPTIKCLKFNKVRPETGVVICHVRDGFPYLSHFLRHYRSAGVRRFAIIDNGSTDGGTEYLLTQEDCDVYQCLGDFKSSKAGMQWNNVVITRYQEADWIFSADIDEFATYEGWPRVTLDEFASGCSQRGLSAVCAIMIDMYAAGPLSDARHPLDCRDMLIDFPYFDGDGYSRIRHHDWRRHRFPRQVINGGPAKRILGTVGHSWLAKTPLLLEPGILFFDPHTVLPIGINFGPVLIGLLHFRFNGALMNKTKKVKALGYSKGSIDEYQAFGEKIADNPLFTLDYHASERFVGPEQLIAKSMIDSIRNF